jgi:hypothetical protein
MQISVGATPTALDELVAELVAPLDVEPVDVPVPNRERVALRCRPVIRSEQMRRWARGARAKDWKAGDPEGLAIDSVQLAALVLAETCTTILVDGVPMLDPDGNAVTLASRWLHERLGGKQSHVDVVRAIYGNDAHVIDAAGVVSEAAEQPVPSATSSTN